MNREAVLKELSTLEGCTVFFRRLAGNTIILYFNGQPGEKCTSSLRLNPSWRYSSSNEWVLGSGDIPWEEDEGETAEGFKIRFDNMCNRCDPLIGSVLESVHLAHNSSDLDLGFSGEQRVFSFAGYTVEESWVYIGRPKGLKIYGSLSGYEVENT